MTTMQLPDPSLPWPICMAGVALIAEKEQGPGGGVALKAYRCPAGIWTAGWGETDGVGPKTVWTKAYADQRFCDSLGERAEAVQAICTVPPNASQLAALTSFAYNCKGWEASSVIKAHNRGDHLAAARAFGLWNKARVRGVLSELRGLTIRRAAEAALYLTPDPDAQREPMPQAVAAESRITSSPIATTGGAAAGVGVLSLVGQAGDQVQAVGGVVQQVRAVAVDALGIPADWLLPLVLVAAGGAAVYWRVKQRAGGWC